MTETEIFGHDTRVLLQQIVRVWHTFRQEELTPSEAYMSSLHLLYAIENALIDMNRMAAWHLPGKLADRHKYAGFVAKWVAKVRPIQFLQTCRGL
jgi:hypothetical protein